MIALAYKSLSDSQSVTREEAESGLTFLGLLVLENKLKETSAQVIRNLQAAEVTTIMATGDNLLTAISVAGHCGIIDNTIPVYYGDLALTMNGVPFI